MRTLKFTAALIAQILGFSCLSWCATYGFLIGARLFHSVPLARSADSAGQIILLPARLLVWISGYSEQGSALAGPVFYSLTNGALLGIASYIVSRQLLFRKKAGSP